MAHDSKGSGKGIAKAEPSDEHPGFRAAGYGPAGKLGQQILGAVHAAVHQFFAVIGNKKIITALMQLKLTGFVGGLGFVKKRSRYHGELGWMMALRVQL
jgi:hypothetical protein